MKHWQELGQILDRVLRCAREGRPAALAVVTRIQGSAYRRPGARLLVDESGGLLGGVSGGCLEEDVRQVGLQVLRSGRTRVLHYETGDDDSKVWGLGLGCDGAVDLVMQPVLPEGAAGAWTLVRALLEGDEPFALAIPVAEGGAGEVVVLDASGRRAGRLADPAADTAIDAAGAAALRAGRSVLHVQDGVTTFIEVLVPPLNLLVCGAGDDSRPLVEFAAAIGFRVVVADHRAAHLTAERFPRARKLLLLRPDEEAADLPRDARTCAVVKMHSFKRDSEWVHRLAATDVRYIGVLGPRARTERIVGDLPPRSRDRIFGPVGLDLGADGPEQVAVSILAELLAVSTGREPQHLRERQVSVHA